MKCIECNRSEENKESGLCDACEKIELGKINGLLYLPAMGLVLGTCWGAIELYSFILSIFSYFNKTNFLSYYAIAALVFMIGRLLISIYATWSFFRCKKSAPKVMIIYYVIGLIIALYFTVFRVIISSEQYDMKDIVILLNGIFGVVIWIPYFLLSKRINIVFCR
ncbi:DUF2569 domain-containing protein [Rosenbergiella epipactidis]|uniref:DUF2569 domain-containing protein n=1 Tax=Rosenbergiella epipactidis TaxID=1544694 RepID=UPI001F4ECA4D|nr:DUF2569 domain-containing protein [Rosenbergiella epipactidis]